MNQIQSKILLYKEIGETPLECLNRFKAENPAYEGLPLTYAGRLDPMAEGLLLVLAGEECKLKTDYLYLSKEYEVEVLFGFETDTGDVLGKVKIVSKNSQEQGVLLRGLAPESFLSAIKQLKTLPQKYPAYSSKTFEGKPLWQWAREGEEKEIESNAKITEIEFLSQREISREELQKNIQDRIAKVTGDFRQKEILDLWNEKIKAEENYQVISIKVLSTGGAYMRVLAQELGKILGVPSLAFSIKRTKVGEYTIC